MNKFEDKNYELMLCLHRIANLLNESPDYKLRGDIANCITKFIEVPPLKTMNNEYIPRKVPFGYYERAKYILQNFKKDYSRRMACIEYNKKHPRANKFFYYGMSKEEFNEIGKDVSQLLIFFRTTLKKHYRLFKDLFYAGRSLQEYANTFLLDKKKKTAENMVNILYKDLAAEYERIAKAGQILPNYPHFEALRESQQNALDAFYMLIYRFGFEALDMLIEEGREEFMNNCDDFDFVTERLKGAPSDLFE